MPPPLLNTPLHIFRFTRSTVRVCQLCNVVVFTLRFWSMLLHCANLFTPSASCYNYMRDSCQFDVCVLCWVCHLSAKEKQNDLCHFVFLYHKLWFFSTSAALVKMPSCAVWHSLVSCLVCTLITVRYVTFVYLHATDVRAALFNFHDALWLCLYDDQSRRQLRSLTSQTTSFHRPRQNWARAFSIVGPTVCNALPKFLRIVHLMTLYRLTVSTYLLQADVFFILHLCFWDSVMPSSSTSLYARH